MNAYNIFKNETASTVEYHAIANDIKQVLSLAEEANIDITDYEIELERSNVKDQLGRDYAAKIESCMV